jgi:hypothetical protein
MNIDRQKNSFLEKTKTTAHTTLTASLKPLALVVVGILMMVNLVFLGGGSLSAYAAASTETQSFTIQLEDFVHPAADSKCSEDIHRTGQLHVATHTTVTDNGITIVKTNFNPQGITGYGTDPATGEPTGTTYQGTGVTSETITFKPGGAQTETLIINFNLIGHGSTPDTDSIHHATAHVTVNADGTVTAEVDLDINDCR